MKICNVDGCARPILCKDMCKLHYERLKRTGTTDARKRETRVCSVPGCNRVQHGRGFCEKHLVRFRTHGSPDDNANTHGTLEQRFWRKVNKAEEQDCWEWIGNKLPFGYGQIQVGGKGSKRISAHRLSYNLHKGEIPEGMVVIHSCDNPSCVNPSHLSVGTYAENSRDAVRKGRLFQKTGGDNPAAMSIEKAKAIKIAAGNQKDIAKQFGVSPKTVRAIQRGTHWSCKT